MTDTASLLPQFANQWVLREKPEASVEISKHFELKQNVPIFDKPASVEGKILIKITYVLNKIYKKSNKQDRAYTRRACIM